MPGGIFRMKKDPNNLGRGAGLYYMRGHGYYSKYSIERDRARKSKGHEVDLVGKTRSGKRTRIPQTGDGWLWR